MQLKAEIEEKWINKNADKFLLSFDKAVPHIQLN
jgi:hypothetical protein